jgi:hypothetical protein
VNPEWFYSVGDTRQGPVTEDELKRLAADGTLKPADLVWKDGMPDWVEARTIDTLFPRTAARRDDDEYTPSSRRSDEDRPRDRGRLDDDRPRSRRDSYDDDDRPRARRSYDERDDYDEERQTRRGRKPGQIQAVGIMLLIGGILGTITGLGLLGYAGIVGIGTGGPGFLCCLWPGTYLEIAFGIMAIIRGARMLGDNESGRPPTALAVLAILCILNGDLINCVLGIVCLVMLNDPAVGEYYRRRNV